jgi:hypothetical protein
MSMPGWSPDEPSPLLYHPPTGDLRCGEIHEWESARRIEPRDYPLVQSALIDRLQSEIRYGAPRHFSLLQRDTLNVLRHSVFVADRCEQLGELLGLSPSMRIGCKFLGARHDLHEALPGIKDQHGPALRWYRSVSPELDDAYRRAERVAASIVDWPTSITEHDRLLLTFIGKVIVQYADRDAMAVERAVIFHDRPGWLEQRVDIVDAIVSRADLVYGSYGPDSPYALIDFGSSLVDWLDNCLHDPGAECPPWDRAPVPASELKALRTWYDTIALPQCNALTT